MRDRLVSAILAFLNDQDLLTVDEVRGGSRRSGDRGCV